MRDIEYYRNIFENKKIIFIGVGQGRSYEGFKKFILQNYQVQSVSGIDSNDNDFGQLSNQVDVVYVKNEGIPPTNLKVRYLSPIQIFVDIARSLGLKLIGVTGTKGKGTTSTLIYQILKSANIPVHLAGNIGISPLLELESYNEGDTIVLELSSFQLNDFTGKLDIAVILGITPEHLNWHNNLTSYIEAKSHIVAGQTKDDIAIVYTGNQNALTAVSSSQATIIGFDTDFNNSQTYQNYCYIKDGAVYYLDQKVINTSDIKLPGKFNLQNICASICATWNTIGGNITPLINVLKTFTGLPMHLQTIAVHNQRHFINDTYSTTPEATMGAVSSQTQPTILILGGSRKNSDYRELARYINSSKVIKHVILIGDTAEEIAQLLSNEGFDNFQLGSNLMTEIVNQAYSLSTENDVILLSPGCASFGLFKDYKDRGEQFNQAVAKLR